MKCLLFFPPVGNYQRGEDRCQGNMDKGIGVTRRACNDLGYIASVLRTIGCTPLIRYYPGEGFYFNDYEKENYSYIPV